MASATCRTVAAILALSACSGRGLSTSTQASPSTAIVVTSSATLPRVDLIDEAIAALEARLGGPQQYFEINATPRLVNLFVALNDGKLVQPWVYLGGELSSTEGRAADGFSFAGTALDFDPHTVLSRLQAELPQASAEVFFVEGGDGGVVQYSVAVRTQQGEQLVVVVGADGEVQSVAT
ncbi:MAG: hypothetical protein M3P52_07475 [Actinomycetota bacterium]|nr:hypothetical protein [Actinomycetota bacterium]